MKRGYTREHYLELVEKLRGVSPDVAITSDVIVGFPGETGGDFEQTLDVVKRIEFDHLFPSSIRTGKGLWLLRWSRRCPPKKELPGCKPSKSSKRGSL